MNIIDSRNAQTGRPAPDPLRCLACAARCGDLCHVDDVAELRELNAISTHVETASDHTLIHEGDPSTQVYNVTDGVLMMTRLGADGGRQVLSFLFPGDFVGVSSQPHYGFSLTSITKSKLCRFERKALDQFLAKYPDADQRYHEMTAHILENAYDLVFTLGQRAAAQRVAAFLLFLREKHLTALRWRCGADASEKPVLPVPMTRTDIADFLGLTIETVSRSFGKLKRMGLIQTHGPHDVEITDLERLRDFAESAEG